MISPPAGKGSHPCILFCACGAESFASQGKIIFNKKGRPLNETALVAFDGNRLEVAVDVGHADHLVVDELLDTQVEQLAAEA